VRPSRAQPLRARWCGAAMSVFTSLYRQITAIDLDEVFSYQTTKEVRMLDRRLGMVNWAIRIIVLFYIVGYVLFLRQGYAAVEKSVGHAISEVNGTTYSTVNGNSRPWDSVDAVRPALENGAAFIATTVFETKGQTVGQGTNPSMPCTHNSACPNDAPISQGQCNVAEGFCTVLGWMPMYSQHDSTHTTQFTLETADTFGIWLKSSIQFPSLDDTHIFSTIGAESRTPYATQSASVTSTETSTSTTLGDGTTNPPDYFTLEELLTLARTTYESVRAEGCTLSVSFVWDCSVDSSSCYPQLQVAKMDTNERRRGFMYQYANYYRPTSGAVDTRDLYTVRGVRLLLSSRGEGKKMSISAIMLQISCGIALLWLANFAADFLMLHVLPERKHYRTYKQERTPDFSDLRNKIAEVEGEKKKLRDRKNRFAAKLDES